MLQALLLADKHTAHCNTAPPPRTLTMHSALLWHRSDSLSFALVTGGAARVAAGEGVECKIKGVLQVVDEARGPVTKKDYDALQSPAGERSSERGAMGEAKGERRTRAAERARQLWACPRQDDAPAPTSSHILTAIITARPACAYKSHTRATGDALFGSVVDFNGRPLPGYPVSPLAAEQLQPAPPAPAPAAKAAAAGAAGAAQQQQQEQQEQQQQLPQSQLGSFDGADDDALAGALPAGGGPFIGFDRTRPLVNQQVPMRAREPIAEGVTTGVKALDILTPLGRGASLLVVGPKGSGKSALGLDAAIGQALCSGSGASSSSGSGASSSSGSGGGGASSSGGGSTSSGVRCVYASTGQSDEALRAAVDALAASGALSNTAVFAAPAGADAGAQLATLFAACAAGERVRDEGGHALVILDDAAPLLQCWERLVAALAALGPEIAREGLIKDEEGRDVHVDVDAATKTEQELVEYEGMLVSGAAAQRRGFFSTLFMRAAKMHRARGGGSLSLLPLVPGRPATGARRAAADVSQYKTLTEEQKARMAAVLAQRAKLEAAVSGGGPAEGELNTEAVEEFMSISDGQVREQ